jgi:hypothetical protein
VSELTGTDMTGPLFTEINRYPDGAISFSS